VRLTLEEHGESIGFAASGAAHLVALIVLALSFARQPMPDVPRRDPITIEILSGDDAAPPPTPQPASEAKPPPSLPALGPQIAALPDPSAPRPDQLPALAPHPATPPGWTAATRLYSPTVLAAPKSRAARDHILAMPDDLRDEQLCGFEAMEQIGRAASGFHPDQVVAYAMADTHMEGQALVAEGAAFRSGGKWYRVAFRCEIRPASPTVTAFAFRIGAAIPRKDWNEHGLAAGGDD
jgi:hypothetical protein